MTQTNKYKHLLRNENRYARMISSNNTSNNIKNNIYNYGISSLSVTDTCDNILSAADPGADDSHSGPVIVPLRLFIEYPDCPDCMDRSILCNVISFGDDFGVQQQKHKYEQQEVHFL